MATKASITTARTYVKLAKQRDELKAKLKQVEKEMKDKEAGLIEYFERNGLANLKAGNRTVYTHRQLWASLKDIDEGVTQLRAHGYGDLVSENANSQRLSAWVRELMEKVEAEDDGAVLDSGDLADRLPLPDDLKQMIKVSEKITLRVRKA